MYWRHARVTVTIGACCHSLSGYCLSQINSPNDKTPAADQPDRYWTDLVKRLQPYVPGEQPRERQFIKLNTNENPYGPSPQVLAAIQNELHDDLRLYPDPEALLLRQAIADQHGVAIDQVFAGNGSDEVLALTFQAFFTGRDMPLLFPDISYSFYPVYCNLFDIEDRQVPLGRDFELDLHAYTVPNAGIIFPNPNAPTSKAISVDDIAGLLQRNTDSVVVVDEAYVDFGADSAIPLCAEFPNLLVTRTLSKSASLAGMRIGYAVGDSALIQALVRVKDSFNSYPLDRLAQVAASAAIEDQAYFCDVCQRVITTRERTADGLQQMGFTVLNSSTNFLFITHAEFAATHLAAALRQAGILVRHFKQPRIEQFLRVTVGTDDEMSTLLTELKQIIA